MKLSVRITVPEIELRITNPTETVQAMTTAVERSVVDRTRRGEAADGSALPPPKDAGSDRNPGGRPLQRTGRMFASIGSAVRPSTKPGGLPGGVVRPFGDRPADEHAKIARSKVSAREKSKELRAAAKAAGKRTSGIRRRTVVDNASLAAILSQPPKDPRGIAGDRASYRVFEVNEAEQREARDVAQETMRVTLVQTGTREVKL